MIIEKGQRFNKRPVKVNKMSSMKQWTHLSWVVELRQTPIDQSQLSVLMIDHYVVRLDIPEK